MTKPGKPTHTEEKTRKSFPLLHQQTFADLWRAARSDLGRSPYARDFLADNKERLTAIGVLTARDVERIRDSARTRIFLQSASHTTLFDVRVS
jgi:hypothetical protein